jgi:hypothetical protein
LLDDVHFQLDMGLEPLVLDLEPLVSGLEPLEWVVATDMEPECLIHMVAHRHCTLLTAWAWVLQGYQVSLKIRK